MIQMDVASLAVDSRGEPVVILRPVESDGVARLLPIWIGVQEANAIMLAIQGATLARPMPYDLMVRLLDSLDASVAQVAVTKLEEGTYFAEITLNTPNGRQVIDARPSDSIALATRTDSPIFVSESVLAEAGVVEEHGGEGESAADEPTEEEKESEIEEFSKFLDSVDPDDFRG
ncbi:MAG TPA: bifunctional nuclease family protein [Actinomycetaceae bacterium]|nr:bifunctional nuclease family protein [Actinomycetaceae bacterium]